MENKKKKTQTTRKEIQPKDIWNKESRDKIKKHIINLAKKQTPEERLTIKLAASKYKKEDSKRKLKK